MTRDEAIKIVMDRHAKLSFGSALASDLEEIATSDVDNYVALGMLKLDEPTDAVDRFCDAYHGHGCLDSCGRSIRIVLEATGLNIVEK